MCLFLRSLHLAEQPSMKTRYFLAAIQFLIASSATADIGAIKSSQSHPTKRSFEGLYFGLNSGIGGTEYAGNKIISDYIPGYLPFNINPSSAFGRGNFASYGGSGPLAGGQIGYNQSINPNIFIGIESDFNYSDIGFLSKYNRNSVNYNVNQLFSNNYSQLDSLRLKWFGTLRGRLGYAIGSWFPYVTGGIAYSNINGSTVKNGIAGFPPQGGYNSTLDITTANYNVNKTSIGWTAGAGAEYLLFNNLSLKTEFILLQFQGFGLYGNDYRLRNTDGGNTGNGVSSSIANTAANNYYITRMGLNYFPTKANQSTYLFNKQNSANNPISKSNWDGFYLGANAGYATGSMSQSGHSFLATENFFPGVWYTTAASSEAVGGGLAGVQFGYNLTFNENYVVGFETDYQWAGIQSANWDNTLTLQVNSKSGSVNSNNFTNRLQWFGTGRLRGGYNFGVFMPYVTGGFAYGLSTLTENYYNFSETPIFSSSFHPHSFIQPGWTAGAGVEFNAYENITAKIEYLYTKLGSFTEPTLTYGSASFGMLGVRNDITTYNQDFHQVRVGFNYHFNAEEERLSAKY